jgi:hypothetical protein
MKNQNLLDVPFCSQYTSVSPRKNSIIREPCTEFARQTLNNCYVCRGCETPEVSFFDDQLQTKRFDVEEFRNRYSVCMQIIIWMMSDFLSVQFSDSFSSFCEALKCSRRHEIRNEVTCHPIINIFSELQEISHRDNQPRNTDIKWCIA